MNFYIIQWIYGSFALVSHNHIFGFLRTNIHFIQGTYQKTLCLKAYSDKSTHESMLCFFTKSIYKGAKLIETTKRKSFDSVQHSIDRLKFMTLLLPKQSIHQSFVNDFGLNIANEVKSPIIFSLSWNSSHV